MNILGEEGEFSGRGRQQEERFQARIEQNRQYVQSRLKEVRSLMKDQEYKKAIDILETLKVRLKGAAWMDSETFQNFQTKTEKLLKKSRRLKTRRAEQIQKKLQEKAREKSVEEERERLLREIKWTDRLMERAIIHFQEQRYQETIETTSTILSKYPNFEAARSLREDARKAYDQQWKEEYRRKRTEQWKNYKKRMLEKRIPYDELIRYPSEEEWEIINKRAKRLGPISPEPEAQQEQSIFSLKQKLETRKTNLEYVDARLDQVLEGLREKHGLTYAIDQQARERAKRKRTVVLKDLRLKNALSLLTRKYGLTYDLRHGSVFVTTPREVQPEMQLQIFRTRDLVYLLNNVPNFSSNKLGLEQGYAKKQEEGSSLEDLSVQFSDEGSSGAETERTKTVPVETGDEETGSGKTVTRAAKAKVKKGGAKKKIDLAGLIKTHVAPDSWDRPGASLRQSYNGMLFVRNTPEVLAEVNKFVEDVRAFAGSMVNVSVRFILVRDEFLESLGVEFRDLSNNAPGIQRSEDSGPRGTGVFGQNNNTTNLQSGDPGVDLRFRSNFQNPASQAGAQTDPPGPGQATITNSGGLGAVYEVFDGQDYNIVLRALQKSERAYVIDSTHFTLFNTQRANINISQQRAFIEDVDVTPAANVTAFDPVIGVVQTGLVLDVRPIISFDRKYVTLQVLPSIARLIQIRTFNVLFLPIPGIPPVRIQLPQVRYRQVQSTVRIPDRGALLLGGLTRGETLTKEHGIPVLKNLPVVGALFKETTDVDASQELQILVRVEIINTAEREREAFGSTSSSGVTDNQKSSNRSSK